MRRRRSPSGVASRSSTATWRSASGSRKRTVPEPSSIRRSSPASRSAATPSRTSTPSSPQTASTSSSSTAPAKAPSRRKSSRGSIFEQPERPFDRRAQRALTRGGIAARRPSAAPAARRGGRAAAPASARRVAPPPARSPAAGDRARSHRSPASASSSLRPGRARSPRRRSRSIAAAVGSGCKREHALGGDMQRQPVTWRGPAAREPRPAIRASSGAGLRQVLEVVHHGEHRPRRPCARRAPRARAARRHRSGAGPGQRRTAPPQGPVAPASGTHQTPPGCIDPGAPRPPRSPAASCPSRPSRSRSPGVRPPRRPRRARPAPPGGPSQQPVVGGQVRGPHRQRPRRREGRRALAVDDRAVQSLGQREVLEPVLAEIVGLDRAACQRHDRVREQDLATVSGRATRAARWISSPTYPVALRSHVPRVQPHAHPQPPISRRPPARTQCRAGRRRPRPRAARGSAKSGKERRRPQSRRRTRHRAQRSRRSRSRGGRAGTPPSSRPSASASAVEPSMSVNSSATVPVGGSIVRPTLRPPAPARPGASRPHARARGTAMASM